MKAHRLIPLLFLAAFSLAAAPNRVFLHLASPADPPPVIDGRLDDPCWKKAQGFTLKTPPNSKVMIHNVEETQTTVRLLHDRNGIYAGIVCRQENLDRMKASVKSRDGGKVWEDDSIELFFSPLISRINYYKFDINCLGFFSDIYRYDAVLTYSDWNAINVRTAAGRLPDAWTIEFFVSWKDLNAEYNPGGFIGFQMTRFMWKGAELHVNGSTGGNYARPNMAFVYLAVQEKPPLLEVARKMDPLISGQWYNTDFPGQWIYSDKKNILVDTPAGLENRFRKELDAPALKKLDEVTDAETRFGRLMEEREKKARSRDMKELENLLD